MVDGARNGTPKESMTAAAQGQRKVAAVATVRNRTMRFAIHNSRITATINIAAGSNKSWLYGANIGITTIVVASTRAIDQEKSGVPSAAFRFRHKNTRVTAIRMTDSALPQTGVKATSSTDLPPPV